MKPLSDYILSVISEMVSDKQERKIVPDGIVMQDLQRRVICDVKAAINELCKEKKIEYNKTLNSVAFKIKPGQEL